MICSTPGLPVHHQLPEFTQTHVHWVGDAIRPSHPLSSLSPPAPNPSQHQGLFHWVSSSHEVTKVSAGVSALASVLPMNTQDWSPLGWTGWISLQSKGLSRVFHLKSPQIIGLSEILKCLKEHLETELINMPNWLLICALVHSASPLPSLLCYEMIPRQCVLEMISLHLCTTQFSFPTHLSQSCHSRTCLWCWLWLRKAATGEGRTWEWAHPEEGVLFVFLPCPLLSWFMEVKVNRKVWLVLCWFLIHGRNTK